MFLHANHLSFVLTASMKHYVLLITLELWICHVAILLWGTKNPFQTRRILQNAKYSKYLHVTLLLICSIPPAVIVAVSFAASDYITSFPPASCSLKDSDAIFYFGILPYSVFSAVGVTLFVLILWLLINYKGHSNVST